MAAYLKHVPSGDIYPYHELLARDKEFVSCDARGNVPPAQPPAEPSRAKLKPVPKPEPIPEPLPEPVAEPVPEAVPEIAIDLSNEFKVEIPVITSPEIDIPAFDLSKPIHVDDLIEGLE